ncbi:uncharacterized protein [Elaeis guineensis]|uniref:Uncharacterized protein LOC105038208 n=1 Tax=Elaeis guineensis var. tenera TaxID=51953 RepID=A0A6I9QMK9_ELAGV|nr:uncharacterized protein LOC105038208 [Elaeis guineensis]
MASMPLSQVLPIPKQLPTLWKKHPRSFHHILRTSPLQNPRSRRGFAVFAEGNGLKRDDAVGRETGEGGADLKRDRRPAFNLRWRDLLYPDPENMVAIGLTGLVTWASVQVLGQLFFISIAILLAALKYSFIAALLLFILITLL